MVCYLATGINLHLFFQQFKNLKHSDYCTKFLFKIFPFCPINLHVFSTILRKTKDYFSKKHYLNYFRPGQRAFCEMETEIFT
jgi:hypothetical protein